MFSNDHDNNDLNPINQSESQTNPDQYERSEFLVNNEELIELKKKLTKIELEHQGQLLKYDEIHFNLRQQFLWINSVLTTERMNFYEYASNFYFEIAQYRKKISELEKDLLDSSKSNQDLQFTIEKEETQFKLMKNAYTGVFEAIVKNFHKIYGSLGLSTEIFEQNNKLEVTIEKIFNQLPDLISLLSRLKSTEKKFLELKSQNKVHIEEKNKLIKDNSSFKEQFEQLRKENQKLREENQNLKDKIQFENNNQTI